MKTHKVLIAALLLLVSSRAFCQLNYVLNGDFELNKYCPNGWDDMNACRYWSGIDSAEVNNCDRLDYCHVCAPVQNRVNVPNGYVYYQTAHSGKAYSMVTFYFNNGMETIFWRQYLQGRMYKKLAPGKPYCVSFWANLAEGSKFAINELSAFLDNGSIDTTKNCGAPQTQYNPQITNTKGILLDTANWIKIEGSFIASGTEQFITIGNYKSMSNTNAVILSDNHYNIIAPYNSWYLIDDVSVVESTTVADAGPDKHVGYGDSVYIGRPSSEAIWCDWRVLGSTTIIAQGPGIWVKPTKTTSYVMTQTLCGNVTKDTVRVEVWAAGVPSVNGQPQGYGVVPNPNSGVFELVQSVAVAERATIVISNAVGQRVNSSEVWFRDGRAGISVADLADGLYYLSVQNKEGYVWNMRFVRQ